MAKKIRFPLEMDNGIEVRSVEELRENFSLARILEYRENGKLVVWLRDRYADDLADAIEELDCAENSIVYQIYKIFDVPYDEDTVLNLEKDTERIARVRRLKQYTDDEKYMTEIDKIAFNQDELYDLLDEKVETIYLCGERFSIPLAKNGVSYIGINSPIVIIDSKVEGDWNEKNIHIENVKFDKKYQRIIQKDHDNFNEDNVRNTNDAKSKKKYVIEKRKIVSEISKVEFDVDSLIEIDLLSKTEKTIDKNVEDFFEYTDYIYLVCRTDAFYSNSFIVKKYDKINEILEKLPVSLDDITMNRGFGLFGNRNKILPKERAVCITEHKIVFTKNYVAYSMNHDGSECYELTICGDPMTPITIGNDNYYYLNRSGRYRSLFRYNTITRENVKIAEDVSEVLYDGQYIYFESISTTSASNAYGWKLVEINVVTGEHQIIYTPGQYEHCFYGIKIENGNLMIKDYKTGEFFTVKKVEKV